MKANNTIEGRLKRAVSKDDVQTFRELIHLDIDEAWYAANKWSPIRMAASRHSLKITSLVASASDEVEAGESRLSHALRAQKRKLHDPDVHGNTPLLSACATGRNVMVGILLTVGLNLDHQNKKGDTALHVASRGGQHDIIELLLKSGATVDIKNNEGKTPIQCQIGTSMYKEQLNAVLIAYGADSSTGIGLNVKTWGATARQAAVAGNLSDRLLALVKNHPSSDERDSMQSLLNYCDRAAGPRPEIKAILQSEMARLAIDDVMNKSPRAHPK